MAEGKQTFGVTASTRRDMLFPAEPPSRFTRADMDALLIWASEQGASDITVQTEERVFLKVSNRMLRVTRRELSGQEVLDMVAWTARSEAVKATLAGPKDEDYTYDLRPDRDHRYRFRVNAVGIVTRGNMGVQITLRTIPSSPPRLEELGIEPEILRAMAPRQGMVVITGETGSGKSTLLASVMRRLMEDPDGDRKIITFESPIEYVYDEIDKPSTSVAQTEVPRNLPSFTSATRNALRRNPSIILVGEARDAETMREALIAAMTGHALYTTVHADGFALTVRRMVSIFPSEEINSRAVDVITALKLSVSQTLVPSKQGGRVALREFVVLDSEIREELMAADLERLPLAALSVLARKGQSFLQAAERKLEEGLIDESIVKTLRASSRGVRQDARTIASGVKSNREVVPDRAAPPAGKFIEHREPTVSDPRLDDLLGGVAAKAPRSDD